MLSSGHNLLKIAQVLKSNGTEGEVVISFLDMVPGDIDTEEPVFIYFDGLPVPFFFDSIVPKGNRKAVVRLTGIRNIEDADEIAGADIFADADKFAQEYGEGDFSFLEGWTLEDADGQVKGSVSRFLDIPNNPCLEIDTGSGEVIIPLHDDLIRSVDEEGRILKMEIPSGLFD